MTEQKQKFFSFLLGGAFAIVIVLLLIIATVLFMRQEVQADVPDELASRLDKMVELRTNVTYRIGLLKYLAIQGIITGKEYWEIQNDYVILSADYNGCLAGIIAQVGLRHKVTQNEMKCLLVKKVSDEPFIKKTEEWIKPKKLVVKFTLDGQVISSIAQSDGDKRSPLLEWYKFFDKASSHRLEQETKLMEIRRQSQSTIINLLESFKWPDIGVIRPQPIAVSSHSGAAEPEESKDEKTAFIDNLSFDCKTLHLRIFTDEGSDNYIEDKNLRIFLKHLIKKGVCR